MKHGFSVLPRMPETRDRAKWALSMALFLIALCGVLLRQGLRDQSGSSPLLMFVVGVIIALNAWSAILAIIRLRRP